MKRGRASLTTRQAVAPVLVAVIVLVGAVWYLHSSEHTAVGLHRTAAPRSSSTTTTVTWLPRNPVLTGDFADPDVIRTASGYFAFSTNNASAHVPVVFSPDLRHWSRIGDALPRLPAWAATTGLPVWAPTVAHIGGRYVLAVTLRDARRRRPCIGVGTSVTPAGPYVVDAAGPLVCQSWLGGSIDPDLFVRGDSIWLLWKSDENALGNPARFWSQRLSPELLRVGSPRAILELSEPWEERSVGRLTDATIEGPSLFLHDGVYYLFYSGSAWDTQNYAMGWATCASPDGPCARGSATPFLRSIPGVVAGPGGGMAFVDEAGTSWLAFHGWTPGKVGYSSGGVRSLRLARLVFEGTTPVVVQAEVPQTVPPSH